MLYSALKRTVDILVSSSALLVLAPALVVLSVAIKTTSSGPVLYRGRRVGRYGKTFDLLKFRTMVPGADKIGGSATANNDVRLTPFGRRLRRYKLDELPQFWNVLVGEMSLVGPRPEVERYVDRSSPVDQQILALQPGLTDWATIWNSDEGSALAGSPDPEAFYAQSIRPVKTKLQLFYCDTRSLLVDTKILLYTAWKLFHSSFVPAELASYGTSLELRNGSGPTVNGFGLHGPGAALGSHSNGSCQAPPVAAGDQQPTR